MAETGIQLTIKGVRLNHPNLFKPEKIQGKGDPVYGAQVLIPKANVDELKKALIAQKKEVKRQFPKGIPDPKEFNPCLKEGGKYIDRLNRKRKAKGKAELDSKTVELYGEHYVLTARSRYPLTIVGPNPKVELEDGDKMVYPGCNANVVVKIEAYDNAGQGVACYLSMVQILKGGDPLLSKPDPLKYFEQEEEDSIDDLDADLDTDPEDEEDMEF